MTEPSTQLIAGHPAPVAEAEPDEGPRPHISVVMPAYNEAENLAVVVPRTVEVLTALGRPHEVLIVDDGSTDGTADLMAELCRRSPTVRYMRLRRNYGKSTALQAGFDRVRGDRIVLMDADGQDSPDEVPKLLRALDERNLDLVTGARHRREDRFVKRTTSRLYNRVTRAVTGVDGRDFNSGLKAMRRSVMNPLVLYGELHRYIPVLAVWSGFRVGEVEVEHRARIHGASKFGRARFWRGFLDLITVKFITTYTARPFHLFGGLGVAFGVVGSGLLLWMLIVKLMGNGIGTRPALLTGVLLVVVSVQLMTLGLMAELIVHFRQDRDPDLFVEPE